MSRIFVLKITRIMQKLWDGSIVCPILVLCGVLVEMASVTERIQGGGVAPVSCCPFIVR